MANMSLSTNTPPDKPTLLTLPRELRDKIIKEVLLDPVRPDFESVEKPINTSFKHYFSVAFVNKQLYATAKDVLAIYKGLVIF